MSRVVIVIAVLASLVCAANAAVCDFTYTGSGIHMSGKVVTSDIPREAFPGGYSIESITGQINGVNITGLVAPSGKVSYKNGIYYDNILYPEGPYFDHYGLYFQTVSGSYDVWYDNGSVGGEVGYFELTPQQVGSLGAPVNLTMMMCGVPEVATWALLCVGLAALGFVNHHRPIPRRRMA